MNATANMLHASDASARVLMAAAANRVRHALFASGILPDGFRCTEGVVWCLLGTDSVRFTLSSFGIDANACAAAVIALEAALGEDDAW